MSATAIPKTPAMVEVEAARQPAEGKVSASAIYRNPRAKENWPALSTGEKTLYEVFLNAVKKFEKSPCLGKRKGNDYEWTTYGQTKDISDKIGSGMKKAGIEKGGRCGIFGQNSPEWMTSMQACNRQGVICVPLYDTLGENAIEYIINHAEVSIVFTADSKLSAFNKALPKIQDRLKAIVYWPTPGGAAEEDLAASKASGVALYSWDEFIAYGQENMTDADPPSEDDYSTFMYTSGTTGDPKGVMLTHKALTYMASAVQLYLADVNVKLGPSDSFLSFLPLAHIFDRVIEEAFLYSGGKIGYWQGNILKLMEDVAVLKPTIFAAVPRVYDRVYTKVTDTVTQAGGVKKWLFDKAYAGRLAALKTGKSEHQLGFLDKIVFGKPKMALGGAIRVLVSGGAPLAIHVEEFLKVVMCAPTVQGYGLTETCAASFLAVPNGHWEFHGTVGVVMPGCEARLESVPDMNYDALADPPKGEVLLRGPTVFSGYYKMPEKTAEDVDSEGWFHTGDIGVFMDVGKKSGRALKIIDRKKNIFKLAQGEYVAAEKIEATYGKDPLIDQVWVYGNSFESALVGVIVPNADNLKAAAAKAGITGDYAALCAKPEVNKILLDSLNATGKADKLKGFEFVKRIIIEPTPFDQIKDAELMTPTFKLKRPQLLKHYQSKIDACYDDMKKGATAQ